MKFSDYLVLKESINQEFTIVSAFDEIDSEDKDDLYYFLCKGNIHEVKKSLENKNFKNLIVYESDEKITKKSALNILYEIVFDYEFSKKEINKIIINELNITTKMGEYEKK